MAGLIKSLNITDAILSGFTVHTCIMNGQKIKVTTATSRNYSYFHYLENVLGTRPSI